MTARIGRWPPYRDGKFPPFEEWQSGERYTYNGDHVDQTIRAAQRPICRSIDLAIRCGECACPILAGSDPSYTFRGKVYHSWCIKFLKEVAERTEREMYQEDPPAWPDYIPQWRRWAAKFRCWIRKVKAHGERNPE